MAFLAYILSFLLFLFLLILFCPVSYSGYYSYQGKIVYDLCLGFPFLKIRMNRNGSIKKRQIRLLGFRLFLGKKKNKTKLQNKKTKTKPQKISKNKRSSFSWRAFQLEDVYHIFSFFKNFLTKLKPSSARVNLRVGFSEPDYNGFCTAFYYMFFANLQSVDINLITAWEEEVFEVVGEWQGRFFIVSLVLLMVTFFLNKRSIAIFKKMWKQKRRGN